MIALANGTNHRGSPFAGDAESHSALLHIRTRDVQFDGRNAFQLVNTGGTFGIVLGRRAADVHQHIGLDVLHFRINMLTEIIHALVLKSHTVEHALGSLGHTGVVVALARLQRGAFHDDAANLTEVYEVGKFNAVAKRARGSHHGILQFQFSYLYIQFCHTLPH